MKIIDLKAFMELPAGTIFSKYAPCSFSDIMCMRGSMESDFVYDSITNDISHDEPGDFTDGCTDMEAGESRPLEVDSTSRDGCFEPDQLFAIYEKADVEQLIEKLNRCLNWAY